MPELVDKDACDLLDADHVAVKHLFVDYARLAVAGDPGGERPALAQKICNELTVHARVEEEIFYPALRQVPGADEQMDDLVSQLAGAVEHHVKEERTQLFPKARSSSLDLEALGQKLKERQQQLEAQMA